MAGKIRARLIVERPVTTPAGKNGLPSSDSKGRGMKAEDNVMNVDKCKDSGLALCLIVLICFQVWKRPFLVPLAMGVLLLAMICPGIFKPFARLWFGLSLALGAVVSRIVLAAVFFLIVCPVAFVRRLMGKDSMQVRSWKKGKDSVFRRRDHRFERDDIEHPY